MFENYVAEQQKLWPLLKEQYLKFPRLELPSFYGSGYSFIESKIRNNTSKWWDEIEICSEEMRYTYCFFDAYLCLKSRYYEDLESDSYNRANQILQFELPFWTKNLLINLHSFREKIAHLLLDLYDSNLKHSKCGKVETLTHKDLTFFKAKNAIGKFKEDIVWLSKKSQKMIREILKELCSENIEYLMELRHSFTHGSKPPIETTGTGLRIHRGEITPEGDFAVFFEEDSSHNYREIQERYAKAWDIVRKNTLKISRLEFFQ